MCISSFRSGFVGEKDRQSSQTQLCGVALGFLMPKTLCQPFQPLHEFPCLIAWLRRNMWGLLHKICLRIKGYGALLAAVASVRQHETRLRRVSQLRIQDPFEFLLQKRILHRTGDLHPAIEVACHEVGGINIRQHRTNAKIHIVGKPFSKKQ